MKSNIASLVAVALGISATSANPAFPRGVHARTMSPVQQRMQAAWEADAPRRIALAREIAIWNSQVTSRQVVRAARKVRAARRQPARLA